MPVKMTSDAIKYLLAVRHAKDVFVEECKNGPTHNAKNLIKLDAWAMSRSWANPHTFGYEIKVSRSDFLSDNKWTQYLKYCSQFYFVAPTGVIKPDELPKRVGLVVPTKNGTKLLTKKKAPIRSVKIPEDLFRYVLMCRSTIGKDQTGSKSEYWKDWLEERVINHSLGREVSKTLRSEIEKRVLRLQTENIGLKSKLEGLEQVEKFCEKLNIRPSKWLSEYNIRSRVEESTAKIPKSVRSAVLNLSKTFEKLNALIEENDEN